MDSSIMNRSFLSVMRYYLTPICYFIVWTKRRKDPLLSEGMTLTHWYGELLEGYGLDFIERWRALPDPDLLSRNRPIMVYVTY